MAAKAIAIPEDGLGSRRRAVPVGGEASVPGAQLSRRSRGDALVGVADAVIDLQLRPERSVGDIEAAAGGGTADARGVSDRGGILTDEPLLTVSGGVAGGADEGPQFEGSVVPVEVR